MGSGSQSEVDQPVQSTQTSRTDPPWAGGVSVIICTKARPAELARAIASVRASGEAGRQAEIVVVEETETAREIPGVRYVHVPPTGRGFGYVRNVGLRAAHGALVLFVDDDCEVKHGWVEALTEPFRAAPQIMGVAGTVLVRECGLIGYAENILGFPGGGVRYLHKANGRLIQTQYLSTCNCAYRREAVLQAGGFSESARLGGEDSLLAEGIITVGTCVYTPAAVVYHRPRGHLGAIFQWFIRRGQSEIGVMRVTPQLWKYLGYQLRTSWTIRLLGILSLLVYWPRVGWFILPGALVYYALLLWRFRFARAYPTHRRAWWIVPIVKLTMDLGTEVGRWKALGGQTR